MSSYADTAWGYDEESLGLDPETKLKFVPNEKELKLFKEEKTNMYKGTWMICLVYGISAIALLAVVFLTDWGKEYVYDKFLPAVLTYVIGAIIIIIYLVLSIFTLQPRKIKSGFDVMPICPDYWKLETVSKTRKDSIINNTIKYDGDGKCPNPSLESGENCSLKVNPNDEYSIKDSTGKIDIVTKHGSELNHKCVPDPMVFGSLTEYSSMNDNLFKSKNKLYMASEFSNSTSKDTNIDRDLGGNAASNTKNDGIINEADKMRLENDARFLYKESKQNKVNTDKRQYIDGYDASNELLKYAKLTGAYKYDWKRTGNSTTENSPFDGSLFVDQTKDYKKYPLICNEVYPELLDKLEKEQGKDKLKCELAKTCGISWSKLDCYSNVE
jgi:hypothetical protein